MSLDTSRAGGLAVAGLLISATPDCRLCDASRCIARRGRAAGYKHVGSTHDVEEYTRRADAVDGDTAELGFASTPRPIHRRSIQRSGGPIPTRPLHPSELQSGTLLQWREDLDCWLITGLTFG